MFEECRLQGDFTLSSGRKSNYFYDFDLLSPAETMHYAKILYKKISDTSFDFIIAPAIGGIKLGLCFSLIGGKKLIIIENNGNVRGPKLNFGDSYFITDDVTTSLLTVKKVIANLPGGHYKGIASFVFRGEENPHWIDNYYLQKGESEAPGEIWKPVVGYETLYEVSNFGRIRRITGYLVDNRGKVKYRRGGFLKQNSGGTTFYKQAMLSKNSKHERPFVHKLVLEAFVGPRPRNFTCRHLDGNCENNNLDNLMWDFHVNNLKDKVIHGTNFSKLKPSDVSEIKRLYLTGVTQAELARMFGVVPGTINRYIKNLRREL